VLVRVTVYVGCLSGVINDDYRKGGAHERPITPILTERCSALFVIGRGSVGQLELGAAALLIRPYGGVCVLQAC